MEAKSLTLTKYRKIEKKFLVRLKVALQKVVVQL